MIQTLELVGWVVAIGALGAAWTARYRMANMADAVARSCHELRGPLTAVRLGLALAFRSGQLGDVRLTAIELELGRAALALEDLTGAGQGGKTISNAEVLDVELVDIPELLGELVEAWQAQAAAHGARLRLRDCRDHPLVRGRRLRLAQAIGNLIANANEHGGGDTEVTCWVDMTTVVVEIRDQGPGLPAPLGDLAGGRRARWATWCRTGARGHASSRRGHGLAVATEVAAAHGGRLVAPASPGGARLVLELPKAVRDDAPELSAARPDP